MQKKNQSFIRHVLLNNFRMIIAVVVSALLFLFFILSHWYRADKINEAQGALFGVSQSLIFSVEETIQMSDYVANSINITEGLEADFESNYDIILFVNELEAFVDTFLPQTDIQTDPEFGEISPFVIYSTNPAIIDSKYTRRIERLKDADVLEYFQKNPQKIFLWDDQIISCDAGTYLTLYRLLPLNYECIVRHMIPLDDIMPAEVSNSYTITLAKHPETLPGYALYFEETVLENYVLRTEISATLLIKQYAVYFLMLALLGMVLLLIIYVLSSRSVLSAMQDMLNLVAKIQRDDLLSAGGSGDMSRWEEIRIIKNKISDLSEQISDMNKRHYENQLLQKQLEIEVLNNKINPHLLYNSLSAIKLVAFKDGNMRIDAMTDVIIEYYRLVLNQGKQFITLGQELEYLEKYIRIHEFSKKLVYDVDLNVYNEIFDVEIPHLLLQPIVENTILHGLNTIEEPYISIDARPAEDDTMIIKISDNGVGIETERLEELNRGVNLGYGLTSVIQRLNFYYNAQFELYFESEKGKGTRVVLQIPKKIVTSAEDREGV